MPTTEDLEARVKVLEDFVRVFMHFGPYSTIYEEERRYAPRLFQQWDTLRDKVNRADAATSALIPFMGLIDVLPEYLFAMASGLDLTECSFRRAFPVRIYISDARAEERLSSLLSAFVESLDAIEIGTSEQDHRSWLKRAWAVTKSALTSKEFNKRLQVVEHGLKVSFAQKQQSEADSNQAEAFAKLVEAVKEIPNAAVQAGSLILVKITDEDGEPKIISRTLTLSEMMNLENDKTLMQSPKKLFQRLVGTEMPKSTVRKQKPTIAKPRQLPPPE
jgi:hypothetical protein